MEGVTESLRVLRANTVSLSSRRAYRCSTANFLAWVSLNKPELVTPTTLEQLQSLESTRERAKWFKKNLNEDSPPLIFSLLTGTVFMEFLLSLKKKDGKKLSFSGYSCYRSAVFDLFRFYKLKMPTIMEEDLAVYFKGLKRTLAKDADNGLIRAKVGKDPLKPDDALDIFRRCEHVITIPSVTAKGRSRRRGQIDWSTVEKRLRSHLKSRTRSLFE